MTSTGFPNLLVDSITSTVVAETDEQGNVTEKGEKREYLSVSIFTSSPNSVVQWTPTYVPLPDKFDVPENFDSKVGIKDVDEGYMKGNLVRVFVCPMTLHIMGKSIERSGICEFNWGDNGGIPVVEGVVLDEASQKTLAAAKRQKRSAPIKKKK